MFNFTTQTVYNNIVTWDLDSDGRDNMPEGANLILGDGGDVECRNDVARRKRPAQLSRKIARPLIGVEVVDAGIVAFRVMQLFQHGTFWR